MTAAADHGNPPRARYALTGTDNAFLPRLHPALEGPGIGLLLHGLANASRVLGVFVFLECAVIPYARASASPQPAQQVPGQATEPPVQAASAPLPAENLRAVPPRISYVDGQLSISALNTTLGDVLAKVASLTGVKFDVPPTANGERMPFVELGPGPAREILAELLSDSSFDYLLAASDTDPDRIQSVLIMPREKKAGKANRVDAASRSPRSPYSRGSAPVESAEAAAPENAALPAQPSNAASDAAQSNPQSASSSSDQSAQAPSMQPGQSNVPKTSPVALPTTLDSQSISQQLQQMYQQRMQMTQQARQPAATGTAANPPNN